MRAAGRLHGDGCLAIRAILGRGCFRFNRFLETIDLLDEQEYGKRNDQEIDQGINEQTVIQGGGSGFLCRGQ